MIRKGGREERHFHRRHEERALADADLRHVALSEILEIGQVCRLAREVARELLRETKALERRAELLAAKTHGQRAECHVA